MKQVSVSNKDNKRLTANHHNYNNLGIEMNNSPNLSYVSNGSHGTRSSGDHLINYSPTPTSQSNNNIDQIERNLNINPKDLAALELST